MSRALSRSQVVLLHDLARGPKEVRSSAGTGYDIYAGHEYVGTTRETTVHRLWRDGYVSRTTLRAGTGGCTCWQITDKGRAWVRSQGGAVT